MATYTVELALPPKECSPNWRGHWAKKARAVKDYRQDCAQRFRAAGVPALPLPVRVGLSYYLWRGSGAQTIYERMGLFFPRDRDNAWAGAKSAIDSLQDAGVIPNDSGRCVHLGDLQLFSREKDHGRRTALVVTLKTEGGAE